MYLHVRVCVHIRTDVYMCVGIYAFVYVRVYANLYVCGLNVHIYVRMCIS